MSKKFENHVSLLKSEISSITRNINNVKNKNHKTMTTIVKKLKNFSAYFRQSQNDLNQDQAINLKLNNNRKNTHSMTQINSKRNYANYNIQKLKYKQNITSMKQNYNNLYDLYDEKNENGKLNDRAMSTNRFITERSNEQKLNKSINNMNLVYYKNLKNNNYNFFQRNYKAKPIYQRTNINDQMRKINSNYISDSKCIFNETYNNKDKFESTENLYSSNVYLKKNNSMFKTHSNYCKTNENITSDNLNNKIEKIQNILNCKNIDDCIKKLEKFEEIYQFITKVKNIYKNSTGNIDTNNGSDLNNILFWVNNIAYEKNKYEEFCKKIMYKKNIIYFNDFQKYINGLLHNHKKEDYIVRDIKKKLCDKNEIGTVKKNNYTKDPCRVRCRTEDRANLENFEDILYD